jgi:IclR family mhp operon transcriptional activator
MESTRPIRALLRGLDALAALNRRGGATVSELVADVGLPRTTTYRILETLCEAGFVLRDKSDDRYRLTMLMRGLGDSFDLAALLAHLAEPCVGELARALGFRVALATLSGTTMRERETGGMRTDIVSRHVPLLTSASGLSYLAHCPSAQRDALLAVVTRSRQSQPARVSAELNSSLRDIRSRGHAFVSHGDGAARETTLAIPAAVDGGLLASLTVRYPSAAMNAPATAN